MVEKIQLLQNKIYLTTRCARSLVNTDKELKLREIIEKHQNKLKKYD